MPSIVGAAVRIWQGVRFVSRHTYHATRILVLLFMAASCYDVWHGRLIRSVNDLLIAIILLLGLVVDHLRERSLYAAALAKDQIEYKGDRLLIDMMRWKR